MQREIRAAFRISKLSRITLNTVKVLIIKLGAIGDIIHTLPVLSAIRASFPGAEVSWVAEQRSAEILRDNELLDNLIEVDTKAFRGGMVIEKMLLEGAKQIKNLRQYEFDIAIDFQGLLKSGMIAKLSGARTRWGCRPARGRDRWPDSRAATVARGRLAGDRP